MFKMGKIKKMLFLVLLIGMFGTMLAVSSAAKEDNQSVYVDQLGRYIGKFAVRCNGQYGGKTAYLLKTINGNASGGKYKTNLYPGFLHANVMNSFMVNSNDENRGFGQTLQGTTNEIDNWGSAGYIYSLVIFRQYEWDTAYDIFAGTWSPDQW